MRVDLKGKQALVCASTKGLGYASALELAKVLYNGNHCRLEDAKTQIITSVADFGIKAVVHPMKVDLDDKSSVDDFLLQLPQFGEIDILVINSGGPAPGDFNSFSSVGDFEEKCRKITYSATTLIQYVLPKMREKRWGRIINISSIGLAKPITGLAVSNASRAHLAGLMTGIANENASFGVTLNTVMPGSYGLTVRFL